MTIKIYFSDSHFFKFYETQLIFAFLEKYRKPQKGY